jgi:serine/threonine-protein kinase
MFAAGSRLGPYEIVAALGAGGMGEVYRARDTKLQRDVAVKILPDAFALDAERIARFKREAQVLASLNHPNIGAIYGFEDGDGAHALVLELVDGPTLADRIAQGPMPIEEALPIAKQIAEALEAAHEQGIVHRDLKPANIKVRADGTVKVLDFGLAKLAEPAPAAGTATLTQSPTITTPAMTAAGLILGTAAYMSPEQARGRSVNKRTDVWAFGCVLFEMLSGAKAFHGEDVVETLASIIHKEPPWERLPSTTPATVQTVLQSCLQKDPKERIRDIGDMQLALKGAFAAQALAGPAATVRRPVWERAAPIVATAALVGVIAAAAVWRLKPVPAPSLPVVRFTVPLDEGQRISGSYRSLALSPDGTRLAYVTNNNQLFVRAFRDPGGAKLLIAASARYPVFSPDGQSIAFFSLADQTIKKIGVSGGPPVTICPVVGTFIGMSWDETGILFAQRPAIMRVPADGGTPTTIVAAKNGLIACCPSVLPGGEWILFAARGADAGTDWDHAQIVAQSLKSSERRTLVTGGTDGRYLPSGHLVFMRSGALFAVPFDPSSLTVGGQVPVTEGIKRTLAFGEFDISKTGTLTFVPGPVNASFGELALALIDHQGATERLQVPGAPYEYPRVSPNGKQIAVGTSDGKGANISVYDLSGTTSIRRLTSGGRNRVPVWAPDSEHIAFQSDRDGDLGIFWQRADGATPAERLTTADKDSSHEPQCFSPDGKTLLVSVGKPRSYSLAAYSIRDRTLTPMNVRSTTLPAAALSPDGAWLAYSVTNPTGAPGRTEGVLFVEPFPENGAVYPLGEGAHPAWSPTGHELFHLLSPDRLVVRTLTSTPSFTFSDFSLLTSAFLVRGPGFPREYDVMRDGKRFLAVVTGDQNTPSAPGGDQVQIVLNWSEELKQRVSAR